MDGLEDVMDIWWLYGTPLIVLHTCHECTFSTCQLTSEDSEPGTYHFSTIRMLTTYWRIAETTSDCVLPIEVRLVLSETGD